jgi:hypothetical protein
LCKCRDTGPHFVTDDEVPDVNTHPPSPRAGRSCHSPAGGLTPGEPDRTP